MASKYKIEKPSACNIGDHHSSHAIDVHDEDHNNEYNEYNIQNVKSADNQSLSENIKTENIKKDNKPKGLVNDILASQSNKNPLEMNRLLNSILDSTEPEQKQIEGRSDSDNKNNNKNSNVKYEYVQIKPEKVNVNINSNPPGLEKTEVIVNNGNVSDKSMGLSPESTPSKNNNNIIENMQLSGDDSDNNTTDNTNNNNNNMTMSVQSDENTNGKEKMIDIDDDKAQIDRFIMDEDEIDDD